MDEALEFVTEQLPLPATRRGQLELLRKILAKKYIESIHLSLDEPISVRWHKNIFDTPLGENTVEDFDAIFGQIELSELAGAHTLHEAFMKALHIIDINNLRASHIVVSRLETLGVFNLSFARVLEEPYPSFCGVYVVESALVEDDTFILLGSPMKGHLLSQVVCGVKVTL